MTGNIAARRYARALFTLGKNSGVSELEAWSADLTALRAAVSESPELLRAFKNPIFSTEEKKRVLAILASKLGFKDPVVNFCLLLADKGRLGEIEAIVGAFDSLLDEERGVLRGEMYTAVPLDQARQAEISARLEAQLKRSLILEFGVKPEILGGFVLKVGDLMQDAGLKAQLSFFKDIIKRGE